jgi:hemerythrin-like domain-containing protein
MKYIEYEADIKLDNLIKSLVLFRELKTAVNHNFSSEVNDEEQRLRAESNQHLTAEQYIIINDELKEAINSI